MKRFINCKDCKYFLSYVWGCPFELDGACRFLLRGGMDYRYTERRLNDGCRYGRKKVDKKGCKSLQKEVDND